MKVAFISLGCAKNLVNTEQMMALCRDAGHTLLKAPAGADAVVINTCGFIDSAKEEAIDTILSVAALKAEGQVGKILVTGCLTQRYQQEILDELPEVVYISFDIDGLTIEHCPHTGTPVPGGITFEQVVYLMECVADSGRRIAGFDLVEVVPCPEDKIDAVVGARVLYKLCDLALRTSSAGRG